MGLIILNIVNNKCGEVFEEFDLATKASSVYHINSLAIHTCAHAPSSLTLIFYNIT